MLSTSDIGDTHSMGSVVEVWKARYGRS
jgi:hypothetical protein